MEEPLTGFSRRELQSLQALTNSFNREHKTLPVQTDIKRVERHGENRGLIILLQIFFSILIDP